MKEAVQLSFQETFTVPFANLRTEVSVPATSNQKQGSSESNMVREKGPLFQRRFFSPLFSASTDIQKPQNRYPHVIVEETADWVKGFPVHLHPEEELATRG